MRYAFVDRIYTMTFVSKWLIGLCFEEQCDTVDRECHNHILQLYLATANTNRTNCDQIRFKPVCSWIFFFFIQFNVPFKIISLIETSQSIGWRNGRTPGKPPDTPASRTWLVSHVASAGLEPTPDTAVR